MEFEKLEILKLNYNQISDINSLELVNFEKLKNLRVLDLRGNKITDIKVLKKIKFKRIILDRNKIPENEISEIPLFESLENLYIDD